MFRVKQDANVSLGVMVDYKNIKLRAPIFFPSLIIPLR